MSTKVSRIEGQFIFQSFKNNADAVNCFYNNKIYRCIIDSYDAASVVLQCRNDIGALQAGKKLSFELQFYNQIVCFSAPLVLVEPEKKSLTIAYPLEIYKDLERAALRICPPPEAMAISVFCGESGDLRQIDTEVIVYSLAGMLFQSASEALVFPAGEGGQLLRVTMKMPDRLMKCGARIVRSFLDKGIKHYACSFTDMKMEDMRYLFEDVYGKTFTGIEADFLRGKV